MGSYSIPLSGLVASEESLSVISNDLANLNTTGFKSSSANFSDLIYQQLGSSGSGDPIQSGLGTEVSSTTTDFSAGPTQNTGVSTNIAIQGQGFLEVNNNGQTLYTRDGEFSQNQDGYLVTSDGSQVMGYAAVNGTVTPSGSTVPLQIQLGEASPPQATANVTLDMNLNATAGIPSSQQTGAGISASDILQSGSVLTFQDGATPANTFTYTTVAGDTLQTVVNQINAAGSNFSASLSGDTLVLSSANGTGVNITANTLTDAATGKESETFAASGSGSFSTPVTVYDSLGNSHVVEFNFSKAQQNTWNYSVTIPAADVGATGNPVPLVIGSGGATSGTITFNSNGVLTSPTTNITGITLPAGTSLSDGAQAISFNWDVLGSGNTPTVTQVAGTSSTSNLAQDGYASGTLQSFTILDDGTIQGTFSNGEVTNLGQIALVSFSNQQGLLQVNNGNYQATLASGLPSVGAPGSGGRGTLQDGAIEGSNVDISTAFSSLILAQQCYEANARAFNIESGIFTNSTISLGVGQ
jgi:flagellar hook protein FlgE